MKGHNISGMRFTRLTAISRVKGKGVWICLCLCGKKKLVKASDLLARKVKSCGCFSRENSAKRQFKHGFRKDKKNTHPIYTCWLNMLDRCRNANNVEFQNYGGKGIKVCARWKTFSNFKDDMLPTWNFGLTIERTNGKKGYSPSNCVWASQKVQANNTSRNRLIAVEGRVGTLAQWSEFTGIKPGTIRARLNRGWAPQAAVQRL